MQIYAAYIYFPILLANARVGRVMQLNHAPRAINLDVAAHAKLKADIAQHFDNGRILGINRNDNRHNARTLAEFLLSQRRSIAGFLVKNRTGNREKPTCATRAPST